MRTVSRADATMGRRLCVLMLLLGFLPIMVAVVTAYVNVLEFFLLVMIVAVCMLLAIVLWILSYTIWVNYCMPCVEVDVQGITFRVYEPVVVAPALVMFDIRFFPDRKAMRPADVKSLVLADEMLPDIYCALAESLRNVGYTVERNRWRTHWNLCNHREGGKGSWFSIEPIRSGTSVRPEHIFDYGMDR